MQQNSKYSIYNTIQHIQHNTTYTTQYNIIQHNTTYTLQYNIYNTIQHIQHNTTYTTQYNIYNTIQHIQHNTTSSTQYNIYNTIQHIKHNTTHTTEYKESQLTSDATVTLSNCISASTFYRILYLTQSNHS